MSLTRDPYHDCWLGISGPGKQLREMIAKERKAMSTAVVKGTVIEGDVLSVLRAGVWNDDGFVLTTQLDRKLYKKVSAVLSTCGGKRDRGKQCHVFPDDNDAMSAAEAIRTGEYIDLKKVYQQFDTPIEVAKQLFPPRLGLTGQRSLSFLEPSAGTGALIVMVADCCDDERLGMANLVAVEIDEKRIPRLMEMTGSEYQVCKEVRHADFLKMDTVYLGHFDRVVMNPPFTRGQDMDHVRYAYTFLKPGGILVAIMSPAFMFNTSRKATLFREWISRLPHDIDDVPEGTFSESGTNVRTVIVTIRS